ncbi:MAG: hypothetical protein MJ252_19910, partial [archaeon]|nr:hypothetical protein [archaeon]
MNNTDDKISLQNSNSITDEFLDVLRATKKSSQKKKMIEDLILFLAMNPNYILSDANFNQFEKLFEVMKMLLNENNTSFISVEMNLLKIFSNNFKRKNDKTKKFFLDILPKLFDKFYLQNPKINQDLVDLFNVIVENNLNFKEFFPFIENISTEDDECNYKINLMQFIFSQIKSNSNISFKEIHSSIVELLKSMTVDEDNTISDLAFNSLEILNGRNFNPKEEEENKTNERKEEDLENNNDYKI